VPAKEILRPHRALARRLNDGEPLRTRPDRDATDGFFIARLHARA